MIASTAGVVSLFPLLFTPAGMHCVPQCMSSQADFSERTNHRGCIFAFVGDRRFWAVATATIRVSSP